MFLILAQIKPRLDWFDYDLNTINQTGAFIACAILASWAIAAISRKWSFWCSFASSMVLIYYLIQTQSRGAYISLIVSFGIFLYFSKIEFSKWRIGALILALFVSVFYSYEIGFSKRMTSMLAFESSAANCRAEIYLSGLKMLTDAPRGFEGDLSPVKIYHSWYQSLDDGNEFLNMINSHLEFMCKHGVILKLGYVFFWILIFCILLPRRGDVVSAAAFSVWICFFLTACFTHTLHYFVLWILPLIMLVCGILINRARIASKCFWKNTALVFATAVVLLYVVSLLLPRDASLSISCETTLVGKAKGGEGDLIFSPNIRVLGGKYGKELALLVNARGGFVLISDKYAGDKYAAVVISSDFEADLFSQINAEKIYVLNAAPLNFAKFEAHGRNVEVILGDISDWRRKRYWQGVAESNPNLRLIILPGVADYIPDWTKLLDGTFEFPREDAPE